MVNCFFYFWVLLSQCLMLRLCLSLVQFGCCVLGAFIVDPSPWRTYNTILEVVVNFPMVKTLGARKLCPAQRCSTSALVVVPQVFRAPVQMKRCPNNILVSKLVSAFQASIKAPESALAPNHVTHTYVWFGKQSMCLTNSVGHGPNWKRPVQRRWVRVLMWQLNFFL